MNTNNKGERYGRLDITYTCYYCPGSAWLRDVEGIMKKEYKDTTALELKTGENNDKQHTKYYERRT